MSVKIINVLKDDSFNDILEIFRQSSVGEVILVLPRVGKVFRNEDHFAALASEAQQGGKVVSVLTSNPQTALLARKFGFTVMASGVSKTEKTSKKSATLTTAPPPGDFGIPDFDDGADLGDVPLTSDQTQGSDPEDIDDADPLRNMHIVDDEGNAVDADGDGLVDSPKVDDLLIGDDIGSFVRSASHRTFATLAAAPKEGLRRVPKVSAIDGVRMGTPVRTLNPAGKVERAAPVPIQKNDLLNAAEAAGQVDYIDTVWRGMNTKAAPQRTITTPARIAPSATLSKRLVISMITGAVLVLAAVVYMITGSARVALVPVGKAVDTQITVQASDTYTSIDDEFAKIPGQLMEVSKTAEATVEASGKRDVASKARGKITIYNEYSSSPQALVTNTRFGSSNGKIYRTLQSITVPGSTVKAGATIAGKATVDVIADLPGADYNIPAGKFIIVAFQEKGDTSKVERFYGVSESAMSGGASGPSVVVTNADYEKAKAAATTAIREQIATALQAQGADLQVLDSENIVISDITSTAQPDDAAPQVKVTATGTLTTISFRKQDLHDLMIATMLKKERLVVLPEQLKLAYSDIRFQQDLGTLVFTVALQGEGYTPIDKDMIIQDILGKNPASIRDYFKDREGVESATVTLSPFWVRSVPKKSNKITVDILYPSTPEESR